MSVSLHLVAKLDVGRNYSCFTAHFGLVICPRVPSGALLLVLPA